MEIQNEVQFAKFYRKESFEAVVAVFRTEPFYVPELSEVMYWFNPGPNDHLLIGRGPHVKCLVSKRNDRNRKLAIAELTGTSFSEKVPVRENIMRIPDVTFASELFLSCLIYGEF
jgi:hypothetical protein